jgi:hypothetical protein
MHVVIHDHGCMEPATIFLGSAKNAEHLVALGWRQRRLIRGKSPGDVTIASWDLVMPNVSTPREIEHS